MGWRLWIILGLVALAVAGVHACSSEDDAPEGTTPELSEEVASEEAPPEEPINFNPGFIGSSCNVDADCGYEGGICLTDNDGYPGGHCSLRCSGTCPDVRGDYYSPTACVPDPRGGEGGLCVARCAMHLTASGCRDGYVCSTSIREGARGERLVCLPDLGTAAPATECTTELTDRGIAFSRPDIMDAVASISDEKRGSTIHRTCQIDTPVLLASPLHYVDYRETGRRLAENLLVSCEMARAVEEMSKVLAELEVVEVEHVGTYNCRGIAGSTRLSAHAEGRALDIKGFERTTGAPVSILRDWNGKDPEKRKFLRALVKKLRASKIFRVILTPDYDARHADHLHLEIR